MIKPSVVAAAKEVPSGENLIDLILMASLVLRLITLALLGFLLPGMLMSASFLAYQASSSRSESISSSCSATPASYLIFFELSNCNTPSRDLF